jgi:hypothetical protein
METRMRDMKQGLKTGRIYGLCALLAAGVILSSTLADAAESTTRKHKKNAVRAGAQSAEAPLVIKRKRGFLESGTVVPVGSQSNYVGQSNKGASGAYAHTGAFGSEALPRRYDLPQSDPLFKF